MASNEFYVKKDGDKIILTIVSRTQTSVELDLEDAADLALDIQKYLDEYINSAPALDFNEEAKIKAKEQNDAKNKLNKEMKKWIDNHFGELYDLLPEEREVHVKDLEKRFGQVYTIDPITFKATKKK